MALSVLPLSSTLENEYAAAAPAHARREHKAGETAANDHNIRPVNLATASRTQEIAHHSNTRKAFRASA
jgi:hypothetical protein